jgi:hypothetical protein
LPAFSKISGETTVLSPGIRVVATGISLVEHTNSRYFYKLVRNGVQIQSFCKFGSSILLACSRWRASCRLVLRAQPLVIGLRALMCNHLWQPCMACQFALRTHVTLTRSFHPAFS